MEKLRKLAPSLNIPLKKETQSYYYLPKSLLRDLYSIPDILKISYSTADKFVFTYPLDNVENIEC
jgi:hypothetical protein